MLPEEPVYASYYKLGDLTYKKGDGSTFSGPPCLEGIDFGCRAGVIFSPRDLTCGWDGHEHPRGTRVVIPEARRSRRQHHHVHPRHVPAWAVPEHHEGLSRGGRPHARRSGVRPVDPPGRLGPRSFGRA